MYASLCYCEHVTDAGVELLGTLPSLTSLDLSGCNIQDQGIAALGNNPRFRDLENEVMDSLCIQPQEF